MVSSIDSLDYYAHFFNFGSLKLWFPGLVDTIPQMNNFVIYKGFFDESNHSAPNSAGSESKVDAR